MKRTFRAQIVDKMPEPDGPAGHRGSIYDKFLDGNTQTIWRIETITPMAVSGGLRSAGYARNLRLRIVTKKDCVYVQVIGEIRR